MSCDGRDPHFSNCRAMHIAAIVDVVTRVPGPCVILASLRMLCPTDL